MATWNMVVTPDPTAAYQMKLNEIPQDARDSVEEAYASVPIGERAVAMFDTISERDQARMYVRAYANSRPAGKLSASIWSGWYDAESEKFVNIDKEGRKPALSMAFKTKTEKVAAL